MALSVGSDEASDWPVKLLLAAARNFLNFVFRHFFCHIAGKS